MNIQKELLERSNNQCELCGNSQNLTVYLVPPTKNETVEDSILVCDTCKTQIENAEQTDANHWRCLNDSMWSEINAVKVVAWRMLNRLRKEGWPQDLLDMMYMEDDILAWAKAGADVAEEDKVIHKDSNGAVLQAGDSVVLIKDLNVKGANFTAKRGTAVRNISLVHDNAEQIEGKVEGQQIVILTQFVKKS
ncbi:MAG: PhnA domain-containing protein [Flavobacteriales bacterium]|nr:PhnA domain-containing protein [Flavobacteriales bacterium]